jgi:hypothetical protein
MANDDFYLAAAQQQLAALDAERAACLADLAAFRVNNDRESAAGVVQSLADIEAKRQNLVSLANQYTASQQPPEPESPEMRARKPIHEMNYSDVYEMTKRDSKYGIDDDAFRRGIAEVAKRRARGE